jgi:hypothetical protein
MESIPTPIPPVELTGTEHCKLPVNDPAPQRAGRAGPGQGPAESRHVISTRKDRAMFNTGYNGLIRQLFADMGLFNEQAYG